jgi:hypothetical protein
MERFASLINSLKIKYESGAGTGDLLMHLEEMRRELGSARPISDHTQAPVSIWLPAGYSSSATLEPGIKKDQIVENSEVADLSGKMEFIHNIEQKSFSFRNSGPKNTDEQISVSEEPIITASKPIIHFGTPKPPVKAMLEEDEEAVEQNTSAVMVANNKDEMEKSFPTPLVFELDMPEEIFQNSPEIETAKKNQIPEGFLLSGRTPETDTLEKPKELHEILASRVVAQPQDLSHKPKILAESLGGEKIADLKKGIAINDRFRFIKSLFRGDETLFDRSVKTINNFNILQEAEYWMQRELLIKLGWNEEDELVQQFYHLVRRRFL